MKRVLLKISGELLKGPQTFGISYEACGSLALSLKALHKTGAQIALVLGGGNIFRGFSGEKFGMPRTSGDHMGMLATMINGIALQSALEAADCPVTVMSGLDCPKVVESYSWHRACELLDQGKILLFVGGTGNPYFTTDTAAALRASEIQADALWKATKVDGVYDKDPIKHPNAIRYNDISYAQVLAEKLEVMDATSIALCRNSRIPVFVFNMKLLIPEKVASILNGEALGTWIRD